MNKTLFECKYAAFKNLINQLNYSGVSTEVLKETNKERHMVLKVYFEKPELWYVVYKRDWRNTFKKYFEDVHKKYSLTDHRAESLNVECYNKAMELRCDKVVFCHPEGYYYEELSKMGIFAVENNTFWNHKRKDKRKKEGGGYDRISEKTLLYPKEYLKKLILVE
ncbi:MAG: hypothetical protein ACOC5T_07335 [Elusimicrobiota bacterium]